MNLKKLTNYIVKFLIVLFGAIIGLILINELQKFELLYRNGDQRFNFFIELTFAIVFAIIFYLLSGRIQKFLRSVLDSLEKELVDLPLSVVVFGSIGLIIGLIIALLISQLINALNLPFLGGFLTVIAYIIFPYLGMTTAGRNTDLVMSVFKDERFSLSKELRKDTKKELKDKKILDTSVIIDGRIFEITKTGFLEGEFIMPTFVLEELQHIADSSDSLKRNRGRRGLEVVNNLKELEQITFTVEDIDYSDISEVDSKIVKLAQDIDAKILTNDYNLNKVASVQGIDVLNINELANSLKPIAIPGESMIIDIIKQGQEKNQGVGYLDDGTMIVVEDGKDAIGERKKVIVTSVLQTNAGKMIFARIGQRT